MEQEWLSQRVIYRHSRIQGRVGILEYHLHPTAQGFQTSTVQPSNIYAIELYVA